MSRKTVLLLPTMIAALACSTSGLANPSQTCTGELRTAIVLSIRNATTGAPAASNATVTVQYRGAPGQPDSTSTDTLTSSNAFPRDSVHVPLGAAPGTYNIVVKEAGYADWTQSVVVKGQENDTCQPVTVSLDVPLQPTP